ncbi:MAG: hypothetical protein ABSG65_29240 [Bryobacteraceae bacterium]
MKLLTQFGLCCLLAPGLFAEQHGGAGSGGHSGGVTSGHSAVHPHPSVRTFGSGRYGGYGYGGYYDPFYDSGYAPAAETGGPNTTVVYPPTATAVIAPQTAHSVIHEYGQPEDYSTLPAGDGRPILYLLAFRDGTIRAATTYWVQDSMVLYLDSGHQQKQAPLSTVDRDLSAQLNRERHVPFNLQ